MATLNGGAFNDIKLVDIIIRSPMGTITAKNLGPSDVVLNCAPGNNGDVMNVFEGSTGQLIANKSYKVNNWSVTIQFLRHSLDYCKVTYLIEQILAGNIATCGIEIINKNFDGGENGNTYERLYSDLAFLVNFAGLEAGAGASGDFQVTFKTSNATFTSGAYKVWSNEYATSELPDQKLAVYYPADSWGVAGERYQGEVTYND